MAPKKTPSRREPRRIAVLTGGGDCPGLNAVIRAVVLRAHGLGLEVLGGEDGLNGLLSGTGGPTRFLTPAEVLDKLPERYPGLTHGMGGENREQGESLGSLRTGALLALLAIYVLLAIPFKSYVQPFIVMAAIPFGIVGAIIGHVMLGFELSMISMMGMVALSGVVVNDSLVLIDATNEYRRRGASHFDAVVAAGVRRFRPILLTSVTTFFGLIPMILEPSVQARFLIPMARRVPISR